MSDNEVSQPTVFLKPDAQIRGQNFGLISFLTPPQDISEKKEAFLFANYLNSKKQAYNNVIQEELDLAKKSKEQIQKDRLEIIAKLFSSEDSIIEDYKGFKNIHGSKLEDQFNTLVKGVNTMHGVKMRGTYDTVEEAKAAAEALQKIDPHHHIYVGTMGYWLPWNPNTDEIKDQKYMDNQLDEIMRGYRENQAKSKEFFEDRKNEMMEDVAAENLKRKKENEAAEAARLKDVAEEKSSDLPVVPEVKDETTSPAEATLSETVDYKPSAPPMQQDEQSKSSPVTFQMESMVNAEPFLGSASLKKTEEE